MRNKKKRYGRLGVCGSPPWRPTSTKLRRGIARATWPTRPHQRCPNRGLLPGARAKRGPGSRHQQPPERLTYGSAPQRAPSFPPEIVGVPEFFLAAAPDVRGEMKPQFLPSRESTDVFTAWVSPPEWRRKWVAAQKSKKLEIRLPLSHSPRKTFPRDGGVRTGGEPPCNASRQVRGTEKVRVGAPK